MKKLLLICILAGYSMTAGAIENSAAGAHSKHLVKHHAAHAHHAKKHVKLAHHVKLKLKEIAARPVVNPESLAASQVAGKLDTDLSVSAPSEFVQPASSPKLLSSFVLIYDLETQRPLYTKNPDAITPIASITKLMTAMVVLDAKPDLNEELSVDEVDTDHLKNTRSRLSVGTTFIRSEMLKLALMSSENRAAATLARNYPGGTVATVAAMNAKARQLGMMHTTFRDPTGLNCENVSTARDLVKMVDAARNYALIHQYTTTATHSVEGMRGRELLYNNTNPLVKNASWEIGLSKTGFINEAGHCLVMQAKIHQRPVIIVLLDSVGKSSRVGDANRVKKWIESSKAQERIVHRG